jgi:ribose transport system substrate-binding protein
MKPLPIPGVIPTLAAIGMCAVLSTGCRPAETEQRPRIALVMKSLANEFFLTMENGARAHHRAHADDYDLIVNGIKDELDVGRQIDIVDQMIAQRVDAIVIAPADSKALVPISRKAMQAGIVVVNIDNQFDRAVLEDNRIQIPFVGPDNRKGARLVGDYLAGHLSPGDAVAIIEGAPNAYNGIQRKLGFEDAMNAAGMKIVSSQSGYWETDRANQVAAAMINEHPTLKAILCANDSMALGAVAALRAAGKLGQVHVVGYDNIAAVQELLRERRVLATADQYADQLAVFGIEYALDMMRGQDAPADRETPVDLVTGQHLTGP